MHADFGCFEEAISAIRESITAARENKDMECLTYSLTWLLNLGHAHPESLLENDRQSLVGAEKATLMFLKSKAKAIHMVTSLSACLLSDARISLSYVSTLLLLKAFYY